MFSRAIIAALWLPAVKGLTSWLSFVMFNCVFLTFLCGIPGQVWYLIVLIPDLCPLSYFAFENTIRYGPTLLDLTSNFVLYKIVKVYILGRA